APLVEPQRGHQLLREVAAHAVAEQRDPRADVDARLEHRAAAAVTRDAVIARPHADDAAVLEQDVGAGESGEEIDAGFFHEAGEPAAEPVERDDEMTVIA